MEKKNIIIVGAGGFGRTVLNYAKDCFPAGSEFFIKGFLDDNPASLENYNLDKKILGAVGDFRIKENDFFLMALGDPASKKKLTEKLEAKGARFIPLIHPLAYIAPNSSIGTGCIICPFSSVGPDVVLDNYVTLNISTSCGHDSKVGKFSVLSPHATVNGFAILEDEVFLGTHATVTPGKRVGSKSKLSAGSVALNDVPPNSLVFGNPGKLFSSIA
ncbi:MAG: acetyltransferase [Nitrospinales bacterium]